MSEDIRLVRIYISEADHGRRKSLVDEIFTLLHDQHRVRGLTVFRGIAGFGKSGAVHSTDLLRLTADLPLVIEFFDTPARVSAALQALEPIVPQGHIVHWPAQND